MAKRSKQSYADAGRIGGEKTKEYWKKRKEQEKIEYEQNPEYCEYCGKIKPFEQYKKHSRFCCRSCSASWNNKHRDKSISQRTAQSLKQYYKTHLVIRTEDNKYKVIEPTEENIKKYKNKKICNVCGTSYKRYEVCPNKFCHKHNLQQIKTFIKYFGFDKTKLGTENVEEEFNRIRNILYDMYWNKHMSGEEIAKYFNYPSGANMVGKILNYLEIPKRSFKECTINTFLTGKHVPNYGETQYKSGWHTTWNNKEVYLRSSYELDYADELDEQHIDYDCECFRIKYLNTKDNEYHCAIPDFYLKDTNTIVEIKSSWTLDIQNMNDKFKAYKELGYNCKLILDHKEVNLYELKFE